MVKDDKEEEIESLIEEAMEQDTSHSVNPDEALATQFYVLEKMSTQDSQGTEIKLLLSDARYSEGERPTFSLHSSIPSEDTQVLSGPYDCPPLPHILALKAWVSDIGIEDNLKSLNNT